MVTTAGRGYTSPMKILSALASLTLVCMCGTATAQWQWKDKDGRLVFSDTHPPADVVDKDIIKRPIGKPQPVANKDIGKDSGKDTGNGVPEGGAASNAPALPVGVDKDLEAKKKQAVEAEAAKKKAEEDRLAKVRVENCARAKQAMSNLDSGVRISRTNSAGEREVLDDAARSAERTRIQNIMASECR
jgi:hypothetical protein